MLANKLSSSRNSKQLRNLVSDPIKGKYIPDPVVNQFKNYFSVWFFSELVSQKIIFKTHTGVFLSNSHFRTESMISLFPTNISKAEAMISLSPIVISELKPWSTYFQQLSTEAMISLSPTVISRVEAMINLFPTIISELKPWSVYLQQSFKELKPLSVYF